MDASHVLNQYKKDMLQGEVLSADPHRLIQMLLEGALNRIALAKHHMVKKNIAEKGKNISSAIAIIDCLQTSLDFDAGGEIAVNLNYLYDYSKVNLLLANRHNEIEKLDEVKQIISQIKTGWDGIADVAAEVISAEKPQEGIVS